jgi:glucose-1-phosphate thymidylyltransferase
LGDNIFYGRGLSSLLWQASSHKSGAVIFGYYLPDPQGFGIVEFDAAQRVISIEEKPARPKSNYAVPGLYFYDGKASALAKKLSPSARGELEITDLNKEYLKLGELKVELFGRGMAWLDTGTNEGLLSAAEFVSIVQKRQGLYISCIEEIAYRKGYITKDHLEKLAQPYLKTNYGQYLLQLVQKKLYPR